MTIQEDKKVMRKKLKAQRAALPMPVVEQSSKAVCEAVLASALYAKAHTILGYLAFGTELNIDSVLLQAIADGKRVCVPRITSDTTFDAVVLHDLQHFAFDRFGIRNVVPPYEVLAPGELDLILVPGVAFGRDGSRMGMGAGFYDRYMQQAPQAVRVGLAYDALLQQGLPCDAYDQKVQYLISESGLVKI